MKTRLLKPLIVVIALYLIPIGMVSAMLTSPVYADETTEINEHTLEFNDKKIRVVLGSDDKNKMIHEVTSNEHVFISVSADEKEISVLTGILSKLAETEWDQLDEAERQEIIQALEQVEAGIQIDINEDNMGAGKIILAVIAILSTFGLPFIIIALILYYKHRKRRQRDILIGKFIDAGKEVPIEILMSSGAAGAPTGNFERGIMLMGIGIGLFLFLGMLIGWDIASVALIPLFIGVARVVIWSLGNRTETKADNQ
ncbi:MAG: DUF6249 domain-containing protein [Proteobacteria bacterium]|jgi:hypothetical protein|uniref:DUF6249 domain-containing protein n=1 Tax=SAR92 bacterium BACL26 MAG-121220-bin70 TaxID=1655626 RepID=A0A0R2UBL6_9GAMM|nr:MAG: hypothetical protein ABS24_03665 [SAR92 bacterium BACL26 MAG-121220-bin70]MDA0796520.1 DUF6249 domain-containing protein [Pseudomonadota bacterium]MDA1351865.1 DUF6249 domain-containing protein [Pseudomonadota bacterium]